MRLVSPDLKLLRLPPINLSTPILRNHQLWEFSRFPLQLDVERFDVVEIDVRVSHCLGEGARVEVADVGEHVR